MNGLTKIKTERAIGENTVRRVHQIWRLLDHLQRQGVKEISSASLADWTGFSALSIRKDFSTLGTVPGSAKGYAVGALKEALAIHLGLNQTKRVVVIGLNRLGQALLDGAFLEDKGYEIVAGSDHLPNRLESLRSDKPLFPAYDLTEFIQSRRIDMAVLTAEADMAQRLAERAARGGVTTILNFTPVSLILPETVKVRSVNLSVEFVLPDFI